MTLLPSEIRKYIHYFPEYISEEIFFSNKYNYRTLRHPIDVDITPEQYEEAVTKWKHYNVDLPLCAKNNNKGIALEKSGNIKAAIKVYEKNIGVDKYPARHAYDRLMVLYRKLGDYENEERVVRIATIVFPNEQKYTERLTKVEKILSIK